MATIKIQRESEDSKTFIVTVEVNEDNTKTTHTVEVNRSYYEKLTGGKVTLDELVEKSFMFLLKREPKESILRKFNLTKISYYFPEYEKEILDYF